MESLINTNIRINIICLERRDYFCTSKIEKFKVDYNLKV